MKVWLYRKWKHDNNIGLDKIPDSHIWAFPCKLKYTLLYNKIINLQIEYVTYTCICTIIVYVSSIQKLSTE